MTKQKGIRVTVYLTEREKKMLDTVCEKMGENMSQAISSLIVQEYYRVKETLAG